MSEPMTPEEFLEWLEEFEPSLDDDKGDLSGSDDK